jgi:hypothetical protein
MKLSGTNATPMENQGWKVRALILRREDAPSILVPSVAPKKCEANRLTANNDLIDLETAPRAITPENPLQDPVAGAVAHDGLAPPATHSGSVPAPALPQRMAVRGHGTHPSPPNA